MIGTIAILAFVAIDVGLVVGALIWLSDRRSMYDINDTRHRDRARKRPIRYR